MRKFHQTGVDVEVFTNETTVIRVSGEVDLSNVDTMRSAIENVIAGNPSGFVIDLSFADYIDSSGIATIMAARHSLVNTGGSLMLVANNPNVKRTLSLLRLDMIPGVMLCDDLATAVQVLSRIREGE